MKIKYIILFFLTACFSIFCGCSQKLDSNNINTENKIPMCNLSDVKAKNTSKLKFDNSIINIPETNEVFLLEFKKKNFNKAELTEILNSNIKKFTRYDIEESYNLSFTYLDENLIPYEDNNIFNNERLPDNFYKISLEDKNYSASYSNISSFFKIISLNTEMDFNTDNTYFTCDTDKTIEEKANENISYIENTYQDFFSCTYFEMFPFCYKKQGNSFYFRYGVKYKNIPLDINYYASINDVFEPLDLANNFAEIYIKDNELSYITSYYNWLVEEKERYTEIISFETACNLLDKNISDEVLFDVTRIDFVYRINEKPQNNIIIDWEAKPCYKFTIDNSGIAEFPRLAFLVDAITGEIQTYQISL